MLFKQIYNKFVDLSCRLINYMCRKRRDIYTLLCVSVIVWCSYDTKSTSFDFNYSILTNLNTILFQLYSSYSYPVRSCQIVGLILTNKTYLILHITRIVWSLKYPSDQLDGLFTPMKLKTNSEIPVPLHFSVIQNSGVRLDESNLNKILKFQC